MNGKSSWWNLVVGILGVIPTVYGIICFIVRWAKGITFSSFDTALLLFYIFQSVAIIYMAFFRKFCYKAYDYPVIAKDYDFIYVERKLKYYVTGDQLNYSNECTIKSDVKKLEHIYGRYIWTGKQDAGVPSCSCDSVRTISSVARIGIWRYYQIEFSNPINKGDKASFSCSWQPISDVESSSAFLSVNTSVPTKKLVFDISLGSKYKGAEVLLEEYRSSYDDYPLKCEQRKLDDLGRITWSKKPSRGEYLRIRWDWKNGNPSTLGKNNI